MKQREIKFRAWNAVHKIMRQVDQITLNDAIWDLSKGYGVSIPFMSHVILMQFTGLHDKDGKEIYEGDVCDGHSDGYGKIEWTDFDGGYSYVFSDGNDIGIWEVLKEVTVIGNIYQNPELLEPAKEGGVKP